MGGPIDLGNVYLTANIVDPFQELFNILWGNRDLREPIMLEIL